jgi:hypothetical protein
MQGNNNLDGSLVCSFFRARRAVLWCRLQLRLRNQSRSENVEGSKLKQEPGVEMFGTRSRSEKSRSRSYCRVKIFGSEARKVLHCRRDMHISLVIHVILFRRIRTPHLLKNSTASEILIAVTPADLPVFIEREMGLICHFPNVKCAPSRINIGNRIQESIHFFCL